MAHSFDECLDIEDIVDIEGVPDLGTIDLGCGCSLVAGSLGLSKDCRWEWRLVLAQLVLALGLWR